MEENNTLGIPYIISQSEDKKWEINSTVPAAAPPPPGEKQALDLEIRDIANKKSYGISLNEQPVYSHELKELHWIAPKNSGGATKLLLRIDSENEPTERLICYLLRSGEAPGIIFDSNTIEWSNYLDEALKKHFAIKQPWQTYYQAADHPPVLQFYELEDDAFKVSVSFNLTPQPKLKLSPMPYEASILIHLKCYFESDPPRMEPHGTDSFSHTWWKEEGE